MSENQKWNRPPGPLSGIYGLAFVGAAIYFVQHATTFWGGVVGILKALVWPAMIMYKCMELLNM